MTVADAINQKVIQLPPKAQEEVLEAVENIEARYASAGKNGGDDNAERHPLDLLMEISIDGPPDLAERHDFYAHGKLED
jgi:hypothetical protein